MMRAMPKIVTTVRCDQCGKSDGVAQEAWICDPGELPIMAWLHREYEAAFLKGLDGGERLKQEIASAPSRADALATLRAAALPALPDDEREQTEITDLLAELPEVAAGSGRTEPGFWPGCPSRCCSAATKGYLDG
jgi:hypothetical protein